MMIVLSVGKCIFLNNHVIIESHFICIIPKTDTCFCLLFSSRSGFLPDTLIFPLDPTGQL